MTAADGPITPATDTVAIVTGGSCGAGREIVRELARRGYAIVVVYLDDQHSADAAIEETLAARGAAVAVRAHLTDDLDVERLFAETIAAFGGVDVIAHTTVGGALVLYKHAAQHLREGAAIVTLSPAEGITSVLAQELGERGITINGVPPGLEPPGTHHDVANVIACLDRWRHQSVE